MTEALKDQSRRAGRSCGSRGLDRGRGSAIVETLIVTPILLLLGLGAVQWGRIYEAKATLNYATFMAARAGAVAHAEPQAMYRALYKGLVPLYSPAKNLAGLVRTYGRVARDLAGGYAVLNVLNPTREAFGDFGVRRDGHLEIPNERLPILATAVVRMQSAARKNALVLSRRQVKDGLNSPASPGPGSAPGHRPWESGPTGGGGTSSTDGGAPPSGPGHDPGPGSSGSDSPGQGDDGSTGGTGNGNPNTCQAGGPTSQGIQTASAGAGNPVHVVTGNKYQAETDLASLPGELGLVFTRHYNSQSPINGSLGHGWSHSYQVRLKPLDATILLLQQADGRVIRFTRDPDQGTVRDRQPSDVPVAYTAQLAGDGRLEDLGPRGYDWHWHDGRTLGFNARGQLQRITAADGRSVQLHYSGDHELMAVDDPQGRRIAFVYAANGRLAAIIDPAGRWIRYRYDARGNLIRVTYPDKTQRRYLYEDPHDPHNLTGIIDGRGVRYATWAYDEQDRAILSSHTGNVQKVTLRYEPHQTVVTDSLGRRTVFRTRVSDGIPLVTAVDGPGCSTCGQGDVRYAYNQRFQITAVTTKDGSTTRYRYDHLGRMVRITRQMPGAKPRLVARYEYRADSRRPILIARPSIAPGEEHQAHFRYNPRGRLVELRETGFAPTLSGRYRPIERRVALTYRGPDLVAIDGPRTDVRDIVRFAYDTEHRLAQIEYPDRLRQKVLAYDVFGRPLRLQYAGQIATRLSYDAVGRITAVHRGRRKLAYHYAGGLLQSVTGPDGVTVKIDYDAAARPIAMKDKAGNRLGLAWDTEDRRIGNYRQTAQGQVLQAAMYLYDAENRLRGVVTPDGLQRMVGYNGKNQRTLEADGAGRGQYYLRNPAGQLYALLAADNGVTRVAADPGGRLAAIQDPLGRTTVRLFDDFGDLLAQRSPDTGLTTYTYDSSGNLLTKTDARGKAVTYAYDAAGRIIRRTTADGVTEYRYTGAQVAEIHGPHGSERYRYNAGGQLIEHVRLVDGHRFATEYRYDETTGKLIERVLPGGETLRYQYRANLGRLSRITRKGWFREQAILTGITYQPFGQRTGYTLGNGLRTTFAYDRSGRITQLRTRDVGPLRYRYDASGNITAIEHGKLAEHYKYDRMERLIEAHTGTGTHRYRYDPLGNRIQAPTARSVAQARKTALTIARDPAGNTLRLGTRGYRYNANGRLIRLYIDGTLKAEYTYNSKGERIKKSVYTPNGPKVTYFLYDLQARLSAEADAHGRIVREYVYLGRTPVAALQDGNVYSITTDHLGTPQRITDEDRHTVWAAQYDPFGRVHIQTEQIPFNLRFAGQYHDRESGTYYNYFRDYDPNTGRYLQADPLGISQGMNLYAYVSDNPVQHTDPVGLFAPYIHEGILRAAFTEYLNRRDRQGRLINAGRFSPHTIDLFVSANLWTDWDISPNGTQWEYRNHFDNPNDGPPYASRDDRNAGNYTAKYGRPDWITDALDWVGDKRSHYGEIESVPIRHPRSGKIVGHRESIVAVITAFGQNTHTLSDFYAHSNWVDDSSRGGCFSRRYWTRSGWRVEQGWIPPGQGRTRLWDEYYDEVPMANLFTGTVNNGDLSDASRWYTHGYWNKDEPDSVGGRQAVNLPQVRWTKVIERDASVVRPKNLERARLVRCSERSAGPNERCGADGLLEVRVTTAHLLARDLATEHVLKEIERLYQAAPARLRKILAMDEPTKRAANIAF